MFYFGFILNLTIMSVACYLGHLWLRLLGAPAWLSWLGVWLLISAWVMISGSWDQALPRAPCWARSLLEILSFSPSPPHLKKKKISGLLGYFPYCVTLVFSMSSTVFIMLLHTIIIWALTLYKEKTLTIIFILLSKHNEYYKYEEMKNEKNKRK